jgi:hypothetical protein
MKARLFQRLVGHVTDGCLRRAGAGAARPNKNLWRHDDNRLGADRRILARRVLRPLAQQPRRLARRAHMRQRGQPPRLAERRRKAAEQTASRPARTR